MVVWLCARCDALLPEHEETCLGRLGTKKCTLCGEKIRTADDAHQLRSIEQLQRLLAKLKQAEPPT